MESQEELTKRAMEALAAEEGALSHRQEAHAARLRAAAAYHLYQVLKIDSDVGDWHVRGFQGHATLKVGKLIFSFGWVYNSDPALWLLLPRKKDQDTPPITPKVPIRSLAELGRRLREIEADNAD